MPEDDAHPPSLGEVQAHLFALITSRAGVERCMRARGLAPEALARFVQGDGRMGALDRVSVYGGMYFHRLLDVLRADYPKLVAVIGERPFARLASAYLEAHPSRHPSVRHVGSALAEFVAGHALGSRRPWVADLARLEWARVEVYDREDEETLPWVKVQGLAPEALTTLRLRLVEAHEVLDVGHAIADVWRRIEQGARPGRPAPRRTRMLVWRQQGTVYHRVVPPDERALLSLLARGTSFAALCEELGREAPAQRAALRAAELLAGWTTTALLVGAC